MGGPVRWPGPRFQPRFPPSRSRAHQNKICVGARGASGVAVEVGSRELAQRNALREQLHELGTEIATKRPAVEQEVAALDADLATRQRVFADEIARMEQQTATAKAEQARAEHELQDVRMRRDHTQAVYDEIRKKFA